MLGPGGLPASLHGVHRLAPKEPSAEARALLDSDDAGNDFYSIPNISFYNSSGRLIYPKFRFVTRLGYVLCKPKKRFVKYVCG